MQSNTIGKLATALVKVQKDLKPVTRNAENPFFKSAYADLPAVIRHAAPILTANGLAIVQTGEASSGGDLSIKTTLLHESGEWIDGVMTAHLAKNDPQGAGSAVTYLRRYGYAAIIGLSQEGEDDDGNAATHAPSPKAQPQSKPAQTQPRPAQATPETRAKMIKALLDEGIDAATIQEYAVKAGVIHDKGNAELDWPLELVPTTKGKFNGLLGLIENFANGGDAVKQ